jgi:hypothetical protein
MGGGSECHGISCNYTEPSTQARFQSFNDAIYVSAYSTNFSYSIILSASNMTSSDIDFMRSQNKASAWPVLSSSLSLSHSSQSVYVTSRNIHHFSLLLLQVEQHTFDALLRKMPDVIIDFSSAVPVQVFCDILNLCNSKSGFVRR